MRNYCSEEHTCGLIHKDASKGIMEVNETAIKKCGTHLQRGVTVTLCCLTNRKVSYTKVNKE